MAVITFGTLSDRQPGNPDTPISRAQYDEFARRGLGHDKDFYALYDSNADGSWDTAFELSDTSGPGRLSTLTHDDTLADPVTITATGRIGPSTVGNLTNDITYDNNRGFGVSSPGADDDGAHVLNGGEAIDFALNPVGGQAQVLQEVSFVVETGEGEGRDDGHRSAQPVSVYLDFDGSTIARVNGHWQTSAAYALTNVHDGDAIVIDFVNHTITNNGHSVPNVPAAFWAAYQTAGADNLTIGSGADDNRGFAVDNLSLATAAASGANHPAVIGDPTVPGVTEDLSPVNGDLVATGTIPISDADAGQAAFQTTVQSAAGNLGALTLQSTGAYTYSVANSAVQYLGANDSKVDTFTVTSIDGTQKQVAFTIHGVNDVAAIGGVATGGVTEDSNPATLTATGALTVSDVDQGQSSFATQAGTAGSSGLGSFTLDAAGHWTYTADNTQTAIQQLGLGQTLTDSFTAVSSDGSASQVVTVTIHGVNDVAAISGVATGDVTEDSNPTTLMATGALTVSDADQGQSSFAAQAGTAGSSGLGTFTLDAAGNWTYAADNTQTAIQQLGAGQTLTDSFTAVSSDGSASQVVTVTIHGVDDAPTTAPVTLAAIAEDSGPRLITQAELLQNATDIDGPALTAVNLQIASGNGTLIDNGNGTWSYAPAANDDTSVSFSYQVSDGALMAPGTASLDITPVDDAPVITVGNAGGPVAVNFDSLNPGNGAIDGAALSSYFAGYGITISSSGAGADPTVADDRTIYGGGIVAATSGHNVLGEGGGFPVSYTVTFAQPISSFAFDRVTENPGPSGTAYPQWTAVAYDASNNVLGTVGENATSIFPFNGSSPAVHYTLNGPQIDHVTFTGNDNGFAAFANVVTDSWVLGGSGGLTTAEDTPLTLTTISVSDVDAGSSPIQVTLGVGNGALSLGSTAGLTVSGLGSGSVTLTGSQADIDTALSSGLTYTPSLNYNGADALTITANDLGNTGAGGPLTSTQSVNLTVTPVNDPAVISGATTGTVVESGTWFGDEFNTTAPMPAHWDMVGGPQWANAGRLIDPSGTEPFNNELQWYVNPATPAGAALPDPFNVAGGNLTISAAPASINNYYNHYNYSSGLITSYDSYKALYGYFEMRAELPAGKGLLPAFWLLPADGSHAELDAMEMLGSDPTTLYTTVHSYSTGNLVSTGAATTVADMSAGYHTYGVDWEPTTITWYFDGQQVFQTATPSDLNTPMYLIANVAVGGSWPGSPDGTTPFPANMNIDYIRAYGAPPPPATVTGTLTDTDVDNPANTFQAVNAATASDHGYGTFTMTAGGTWSYTLDNANAAVQSLNVGDTLADTFTVRTIDGTAQQVTVTIDGANDAPTITSGQQAAAGSVTEDQYPLASGQITSTDVDHNDTATWSVDGGQSGPGDFVALLDDFRVTSASGVSLEDTFDGTVPLSGVGSPYGGSIATTIPEVDGHALLEGWLGTVNGGFTTQNGTFTTPTTANGSPRLSQDTTFDANARYDFVNPEDLNELYGVRLTDRISSSTGQDTLELSVRRDPDGHLAVQFRDIDLTTNQASVLGEVAIDPAQLAGSQIVLHLAHNTVGSNDISAYFDVIDSGGNTTTYNVPGTGQIFTVPGEDWTRAQFIAREPTENDSIIQDQYGYLTVDQQGHWQFLLKDGSPTVQALAAGQHVTDGFDVSVTDSHGGVATQHVAIDVAGKNDAPVLNPVGGTTQTFDPNTGLSLSGVMNFSDVDLADTHSITLQPQGNGYLGTINAAVTTDSTNTGNGVVMLSYALTPAEYQAAGGNLPAMQNYLATLTDNNGLTSTQFVSIPLAQIAGPYFVPPDNPPVIAGVQTTSFVLDSNSHNPVMLTGSFDFTDLDQLDHHTLSMDVQPVGFAPAALGTLNFSFAGGNDGYGSGAGTVNWTYTVDPSTWPGGVIHHEYLDIKVTDGAGESASHTLDIDYEPGATTTSMKLAVSVAGTAQEGQTLSAQPAGNDANAVLTYQWQSSADNGVTWSAIAGATAATYAVQESDENSVIRVMATDAADSVNTYSAATAPVVDAYPASASVTISGIVQQGQTLDANISVATDSDLGTLAFQWQTSTDNGQHWSNIAGATAGHYTASETDENNLLRVSVVATDDTNQSISFVSAATAPVLDNVSTTIQGNTVQPAEGQILTANFIGDNDGNGSPNTFEWQGSSDNGVTWTDIAGATAQTYQVQESDEGHLLRVIGHGVESGGDPVSVASAATGAVVDAAPANESVSIIGLAKQGQMLTANVSVDTDSDLGTETFQWQASTDNGQTWGNIAGATNATYTATEADEGNLLRVSVTATDDTNQSVTFVSAATAPVLDNVSATIQGNTAHPAEGQILTATFIGDNDGNGSPNTFEWQGSGDNGVTWTDIAGATAQTYQVQESDEGHLLRVIGHGVESGGDPVSVASDPTGAVVDAAPTNESVSISGLAKQGQTLTANISVDTDSDLGTATFQWQASTDNGQTWNNIAGATNATYTATEADEDSLLRVSVTATDDTNQSVSFVSAATAPVLDNVSTTIEGNTAQPAEGQILTANFVGDNDGNGSQPTFQWQGSSDNGATWTDIAGATAQTYQVQEADEGHLLRAIGNGIELGGDQVSAVSAATGTVVEVALSASVTIGGTAQEGQTLSANASTNDADAVINGYQWQSSADNGTTWTNIAGATASTYTPVEADENHLLRVSVAAQDADGGGSATANSAATSSVIDVTSVAAVTIGVGSGLAVQGAQAFSQFLGFGDSNIDSGYFFTHAISNNATLQNQYNAAVAAGGGLPTSIGGSMNSQLLAADYGLTAIPIGEAGGTNYAASGATVTGALPNSLAPSVTSQIQTYLASTGGVADPNALYLISGGGNDFKIAQTLSGQTAQFNYMISAANALTTALSQLQAAGAKYIVIDDGAGRNALITEFNTTLWAGLDAAGVHYIAADDSNLVRQITANPAPYGITNTVQPPAGPFTASNPYSPANGGADIDPLPSLVGKGWSLYATTMQSANAGQTYLWSDNEHLTAAGKLAEANYTHNLIQNSVPTPGEVLSANPTLVGETDNAGVTFAFQWQHSFDDGHTWGNIVNATGKNYTVAAADDDARLRVVATTADDAGGVYTAVSPETYAVSDGAEAPGVFVPATVSATAGGSVALPITVTAADADDVLGNVTISGLPADVTLTDSNNDSLVVNNGVITLTQAELAGLTLHVGSTAATLSITADASEGGTTATSAVQHVALDVFSPLSVSNFVTLTAPGSLNGIGGASDINNAGIVVGNDETYDNITIQGGDGWLYQNGGYTLVHIGNQNNVSDINDYGVLAGFYSPNNSTPRYGFIENGVGQPVTTIDLSPNVSTDVEGINDAGDYVGSSYLHAGNTYSAFSVVGGTLTFFNPFGSTDAHANGINNAGDIVGTYGTHSYLEHNGVFSNIDVPGATQTAATDINNAGQIVGVYWDAAGRGHGYIDTNGVVVTVDNPLGTNSTGVYGINDAGQVAGNYYDATNSPKAFIATINNPSGAPTDDVLVASPQGTSLVGGAGNDTFVFVAPPQAASTIADFTSGNDVIQISAFGFGGGLTHGAAPTILTGAPASVTNAAPGGNFILDNSDPNGGTLYWDANGGNGADATPVAVLHGVNTLLPTDFHVV